jgi:hypothetical protein
MNHSFQVFNFRLQYYYPCDLNTKRIMNDFQFLTELTDVLKKLVSLHLIFSQYSHDILPFLNFGSNLYSEFKELVLLLYVKVLRGTVPLSAVMR